MAPVTYRTACLYWMEFYSFGWHFFLLSSFFYCQKHVLKQTAPFPYCTAILPWMAFFVLWMAFSCMFWIVWYFVHCQLHFYETEGIPFILNSNFSLDDLFPLRGTFLDFSDIFFIINGTFPKQKAPFPYWTATFPWMSLFCLGWIFFSFFSFSMLLFWNRQHLFHIKQEIFLWWRLCHFWWHVSALFCTLCIVWYFFHHWLHFFKTYYTFSILNLNYSFYSIFSTLDGNFLHFCEIFQCQLHLFET